MIRITVELVPHGVETKKRELARGEIWNDGTGSPWLGSYGFRLHGRNGCLMREGLLGEYRRKDFSVWWLIAAVLRVAMPDVEKTFRDSRIVGRLQSKSTA